MSIGIDKETKSKARLLEVIRQELAGWEDTAIKVDPPEAYERPGIPPEFHRNVPPELSAETADGKTLKALLDNGQSLDQAAKAMKALGENSTGIPPEFHRTVVKDPVAEKRRAYDRMRKAKKKLAVKTAAEIPPETDKSDIYISSLTSLSVSENTKKESKSSGIRARGFRLPRDFQLTDERRAFAATQLPDNRIQPEFEKFCDYWWGKSGSGATKVDWDSTWRNWCRSAAERGGNVRSGTGLPNSNRQGGGKSSAITAAIDSHIERFRGAARTGGDLREDAPRLLPGRRGERS